MTLVTHVAPHPDALVGMLCAELAAPLADPFAAELIAVPTRGIERWLTQRIASELGHRGAGDGICANVRFPSPHRLVQDVLRSVPDLAASAVAWDRPGLTASVVAAIDANLHEPWMRLVARHLAGPGDQRAANQDRLSVARKVARLFDRYARRRPDMIRSWASGDNLGPDGSPLPDDAIWQARLWQRVHSRVGVASLPEVLPDGLEPIRSGSAALDLPGRLGVYGLTAVDPLDLDVLAAVATRRTVHLYLLHPSPRLWVRCAEQVAGRRRRIIRGDDPTAALADHPMLRSWGQDSRELQVVLAGRGIGATPTPGGPTPTNRVLGRLQEDIRANRAVAHDAELARLVERGADRSIQVHVCHGARRQVEVLRDAILHVLSADPTLEPRDVVIMTPDLETFAPLLEAAFPNKTVTHDSGGVPDLRVRIADRSPAATNPLVRFAATVLDLADSRLEAGVVRELVARPVVRQRFGFDTDTAGGIVSVIDDTNVRWGLDGTDRERWGAGANNERTWGRALDRALAGVFYPDSPVRVVADIAPLDGVEGQDATPVALLASIIDRIAAIRDLLGEPMAMSAWPGAVAAAVRLLAAPAWGEEWQWGQLERLLAETFPAGDDRTGPEVTLTEARGAIASWADDRPSPLHFRSGDVTVCTLLPMRSVPYRVVCLLGMDDDRFPRSSRLDGDDLLVGNEAVGDHDAGAEDRQLLLDAVMAAGDNLLVTYSGHDELTSFEYPAAVPVAELIDTVRDMVGHETANRLVTDHPLQSFAERNFIADALSVAGPWGFDPMHLAGAVAAQRRTTVVPVTPAAAPVWPEREPDAVIRLDDLIGFLHHPVGRFVRSRLGFSVPDMGEVPDDSLTADLDALSRWSVTDRILSGLVAGHDLDALAARERRSDALPPADLGTDDLDTAIDAARSLWEAARERGYDPQRQRPWSGAFPVGDRLVEGTVLADADRAHIVTLTPSRLKAKQRLRSFVELVFISAIEPGIAWEALLLGRGSGDGHQTVTIGPIADLPDERKERAARLLADLVDLYDEGHRAPVPIPCETAYAWHRHVGNDRGRAFRLARDAWEGDYGEGADGPHSMLFPALATSALIDAAFEAYCARLWGPVLPLLKEKRL